MTKTQATRKIAYVGSADKIDMRPAVGFALDDTSDEAMKFIFYPVTSRSNPQAGLAQTRDGVEVTEDQAFAILTSPFRLEGFVDITDRTTPLYENLGSLPLADPSHAGLALAEQSPTPPDEVKASVAASIADGTATPADQQTPMVPVAGGAMLPDTPAEAQPTDTKS